MRLGLSGLNEHRHRKNFIDNPYCPNCPQIAESNRHYILECPTYAVLRRELIVRILDTIPMNDIIKPHFFTETDNEVIIRILINGTKIVKVDKSLFDSLSSFIIETKRFNFSR